MISINDIRRDINYEELGLLESYLMHEYKRIGREEFISKYKDIEKTTKELELDKDYLVNFVKAIVSYFSGAETKSATKMFIADVRDYSFIEEMSKNEINDIYKNSIKSFRDFGFLYSEICEAI